MDVAVWAQPPPGGLMLVCAERSSCDESSERQGDVNLSIEAARMKSTAPGCVQLTADQESEQLPMGINSPSLLLRSHILKMKIHSSTLHGELLRCARFVGQIVYDTSVRPVPGGH